MSNFVVALVMGIGCGGWVYSRVQRRTGGNTQTSLIAAGVCGLIAAIVMWSLLALLFSK